MTRLEKNKVKKNHRKYAIGGTVSIIMFAACMILGILVSTKGFKTDAIFIGFSIFYMIVGFVFMVLGVDCEYAINRYRGDLNNRRHQILLKIGVEALNNKDIDKAINVQKIMKSDRYKLFLKGFILAFAKFSGDEKLLPLFENNITSLY